MPNSKKYGRNSFKKPKVNSKKNSITKSELSSFKSVVTIEMLYRLKYGSSLNWRNLNDFIPFILKNKIKEQKKLIYDTIKTSKKPFKEKKDVKDLIAKTPYVNI